MIDIHCHLLPEVDDGPKSWDAAVEMCRMAAADGITHAVATPHANDRYAYDRAYLSGLLGRTAGEDRSRAPLQLSLGCDFHLSFENLERVLEQPHTYTIGETNYLLIELSNYSVPTQLGRMFYPPGRSRAYADPDPSRTEPDPAANAAARSGMGGAGLPGSSDGLGAHRSLGRAARIVARWLLDRSAVHILASRRSRHQAPGPEPFRGPRGGGKNLWEPSTPRALVEGNPGAIVKGCRSLIARGRCWS